MAQCGGETVAETSLVKKGLGGVARVQFASHKRLKSPKYLKCNAITSENPGNRVQCCPR